LMRSGISVMKNHQNIARLVFKQPSAASLSKSSAQGCARLHRDGARNPPKHSRRTGTSPDSPPAGGNENVYTSRARGRDFFGQPARTGPSKLAPFPGAKRLRDELQKLRATNAISERVTELEQILASAHVVDPPDAPSNSVTFGATVTVKDKKGATETLTIVGVDELDFERDAVSWISPLGKALLAADMGDWIKLDDGRSAKIVKIVQDKGPPKMQSAH